MKLYKNKPISKISSLSKILDINDDLLIEISKKADNYFYIARRVIKPNGDSYV